MHHSASATYKIDDQRVCRSGQNDAADMHRGTLTDNGRQGETEQTGCHHGEKNSKQINSQEKEKRTDRWTGKTRQWREQSRGEGQESS